MFIYFTPINETEKVLINTDQVCALIKYDNFHLIKTSDGAHYKVSHTEILKQMLEQLEPVVGGFAFALRKKHEKPTL